MEGREMSLTLLLRPAEGPESKERTSTLVCRTDTVARSDGVSRVDLPWGRVGRHAGFPGNCAVTGAAGSVSVCNNDPYY
jgi:hypothetical protein